MARKAADLRLFALTQYLNPDYYAWGDDAKAYMRGLYDSGRMSELSDYIMGTIVNLIRNDMANLQRAGLEMTEAYGIMHDRDETDKWDEVKKEIVRAPKPHHVHMVFRFSKGYRTLDDIARVVGIEPQYIEKAKSGPKSFENMVSYLIHIKYAEKYQYEPDDVKTYEGEDYVAHAALHWDDWLKGRAVMQTKKAEANVDDLVEKALNGQVTKEQIILTDEYAGVYARNTKKIDDALNVYAQRRALRAANKLRNREFDTHVTYVQGKSGAGKSRWAMYELIPELLRAGESLGEEWGYYTAATSNPFDDWAGEEIILMDDARPYMLTANDWLRLFDPTMVSPANARYKNKPAVAPRHIVVTSYMDPLEFFYYVRQKGEVSEALDQFIRRLSSVVQVIKLDDEHRVYVVRGVHEKPSSYYGRDGSGGFTEVALSYSLYSRHPELTSAGAVKAVVNESNTYFRDIAAEPLAIESADKANRFDSPAYVVEKLEEARWKARAREFTQWYGVERNRERYKDIDVSNIPSSDWVITDDDKRRMLAQDDWYKMRYEPDDIIDIDE